MYFAARCELGKKLKYKALRVIWNSYLKFTQPLLVSSLTVWISLFRGKVRVTRLLRLSSALQVD